MAISDTQPLASYPRGGKTVFSFNVRQTIVADPMTGKTRTQYEYDEAKVSGKPTRAKVLAAMKATTREQDANAPTEAEQQLADSKAALSLAGIATMSYAELDTYIEANVTTLATSKVFLKKLAKVVLSQVKQAE